ncbi:WD repeat-containing protein 75 [Toxorhynchites rutilus septentrionalis]|uniref:WD repeat-containing protein 75 n=1 Tax=Toxorhynchites rutilus septentrionalis TaxID=329112 RepID=UPI0024792DD5|nr:WD repeat-containing protein 75 [Toxorhynchites rutilus septentrionalis]XP_055635862.1 WD repeat-containing protein 75 [Toxorhynchites rutilus septentrionalis]
MCIENGVVESEENNLVKNGSKMQKTPQNEEPSKNGDELRIRRIAGGSMINRAPLFSPDGSIIYVIWEKTVRAFSVTTGEYVRDYEGVDDDILGIVINRNNQKFLYGCTKNGVILGWNAESGVLHEKKEILLNTKFCVNHFSILYDENDSATFLVSGVSTGRHVFIYCPTKRMIIQSSKLTLEGAVTDIRFASGGDKLNFFAYITGELWHWVKVKPAFRTVTRKHCNGVQTRVIACHPTEDIVAIGDAIGRVVLYKHFLETKAAVPEIYHWHPNPVQCVVFSHTGTHFYSGGLERVLVKWTIGKQTNKDMLPRLSDTVVQIAVAPENLKVALCTADNGIRILNALQKQTATIQSFSRISEDYTGRNPFPVGLRVNPRTQALVLNGRVGCVQFFSTYSRSLLYTLDITLMNYNTIEQQKVIYNTMVTNVAVNAFWLATVETWNDNCYSSETRLKFWKYDESRQNYSLNVNVENVHLGGVNGLEFSNGSKERDVLCATAGKDRCVKIWSPREIEITGGGEKLVWMCIGRVEYKNLPVKSISFSQDGSLLAGGFGSVLCAWSAETLSLKCALSAPAGYDGGMQRVVLSVSSKTKQIDTDDYLKKKSKIIEQMLQLLEKKDGSDLRKILVPFKKHRFIQSDTKRVRQLSEDQKKLVFKRTQLHNELTISQKAELFYRLRIQCRTVSQMKDKIAEKLAKAKQISCGAEKRLQRVVDELCSDVKFRCKRKLHNLQRKKAVSLGLSQLTSVFDTTKKMCSQKISPAIDNTCKPVITTTQINHAFFCYGEHSHLVVMCTENRLLVWNLLTLRIQVTVNLTVDQIAIDSFNNLIAAFTADNELYIFLPNIPMPLYHRKNLPSVYGAVWIPRRYPKSQSLNVDWQAVSQLYFLNQKQELLHLVSDSDEESLGPVVYMNDMATNGLPNTPFAAMLAKQTGSRGVQVGLTNATGGRIGFAGKSSVKEIVASSAHTMAPINLLCEDFLKSLLIVEERRRKRDPSTTATTPTHAPTIPVSDDSESDSESTNQEATEVKSKISARKAVMDSIEKAHFKTSSRTEQIVRDSKLKQLMEEDIEIAF